MPRDDEAEIARRRDELLAAARGEKGGNTGSGGRLAGLGVQFVLAILVGLFLGRWLDHRLGTQPWLLLAGVFVGAGAGFYAMYRAMIAEEKREP